LAPAQNKDISGQTMDFTRPQVMGILNVTPDSFSDGGRFLEPAAALDQAATMVAQGAEIIDVGGESTRPGAAEVPLQQELDRVIPVIEAVGRELAVSVSVDTSKAEVMREAVNAGADMINDVTALRGEGALATAAELGVPVCLMHMQGEPRTMQAAPHYQDVVEEVAGFLQQRRQACQKAGILDDNIVIDPGFGFGKTVRHNLTLFQHLPRFAQLGRPLLVGVSRKSMFAKILDKPAEQRLHGSVTLAALAIWMGASIVRVHDVGPTVDAIKTVRAVQDPSQYE
jgi:dihydropteroate synthase